MQLWVHQTNPTTGNNGGFVDVRPDAAALALIGANQAQRPQDTPLKNVTAPCTSDWDGSTAVLDSAAPRAPEFTSAPVISGAKPVGSVLTRTSPGSYTGNPAPVVTNAWCRDGTPIAAQTNPTYTTVAGDVGKNITCRVTLTNASGAVSQHSNAIIPT